jgi:hypothetical protein
MGGRGEQYKVKTLRTAPTHQYLYLHSCSNTHVYKITNVPVFFYMALGLDYFDGANPLLRPSEGISPEDLVFFLAQMSIGFACCHLRAPKSYNFQAHPF